MWKVVSNGVDCTSGVVKDVGVEKDVEVIFGGEDGCIYRGRVEEGK